MNKLSTVSNYRICKYNFVSVVCTQRTVNSLSITGSGLLLFLLNDELYCVKTHVCPWKSNFLRGIIPIQYWANTYQSRGPMNRTTAWPSFTEYGAFEKRAEWHTLPCSCQCLHTKSYNYFPVPDWMCGRPNQICFRLHLEAGTNQNQSLNLKISISWIDL